MISCGARLAVFDIAELREVTAYDELELDTLGDRKTALFLIMSDTDDSFNFLISMCYTQLFNLLCEKADDVYGGRLPVHVTHSGEGEGLLFYGSTILPFVDHFPKNTELYRIMTTKPQELKKKEDE